MKKVFLFAPFLFFYLVGCEGDRKETATADEAAEKAVAVLTDSIDKLEEEEKQMALEQVKLPLNEETKLPHSLVANSREHILNLTDAAQSHVVKVNKVLQREGVSEKTKAAANQAIEKANQTIGRVRQAVAEIDLLSSIKFLGIDDLESLIEAVTKDQMESTGNVENSIRATRDSIEFVKDRLASFSRETEDENISEEVKTFARQVIEKANQVIEKAEQAIHNLLRPVGSS